MLNLGSNINNIFCNSNEDDEDGNTGVTSPGFTEKVKEKTKKPSLYKVLLLNDDYTPMEFVVHILERYFNKNRSEAEKIMLQVHHRGVGVCGVFTYEVAETKVTQVMLFAQEHQHPLQCTMEKE
ncbi:MAG: ATP-dependent Clp protease adapter ClpS [Rhodomicrobiaceae bacterium]|jgi:ATP-dependent Clp protease adaptor protein ClpS|nr:MAG: ATP-dependent Clp protease adapter protein ClpS [Methyloligella sp.]